MIFLATASSKRPTDCDIGHKRELLTSELFGVQDPTSSEQLKAQFDQKWKAVLNKQTKFGLIGVLISTTCNLLLAPIFPKLCYLGVNIAQPFLLQRMLTFLQSKKDDSCIGYGLVGAFALVYFIQAISQSQYGHAVNKHVAEIRSILIHAIFQHSLDVSVSGLKDGQVATLVNNDIQIVMDAILDLHETWASILVLPIAIWLLYRQISYA